MTKSNYCAIALRVLHTEIKAIEGLTTAINTDFQAACDKILNTSGKVIVMGMGKSGHIAKKIAATFASTGTPAFFVHPAEASHGDLGMLTPTDIVLCISNSGEAHEIKSIYPVLKRRKIFIISITGNDESNMAKLSDIHLNIGNPEEACPLGLAPTSSTTATLVLGDALAIALLDNRGFSHDDFALSHPGGALGRKLLLKVSDVMHSGEFMPVVNENATVKESLLVMTQKGLGMTAIVNQQQQLIGVFTDGDLRRLFERSIDIHTQIVDAMSSKPITVEQNLLAAEAITLMEAKKINALCVCEGKKLLGVLNMHDLLKAGLI